MIGLLAAALVAACHGHKAPDVDDTGAPAGTDPDTDRYPTIWYVDGDGDGYGGTDTAIDPPDLAGYAARSGDCDDTRAWVHPSALELPTSGVDDNCDGTLAIESVDQIADFRATGFFTGSPTGPVFDDESAGIALGNDTKIALVRAPLAPLDDAAPTAATSLVGTEGEARTACAVGDVDGDGHEDLVISGPAAEEAAGGEAGSASIVLGPIASGTHALGDIAWRRYEGDARGEDFGVCIAAGDVNGDGLADVVLGAQYDPAAAWDAGSVYIFHGPATQTDVQDADAILRGTIKDERIGNDIAALGDIDGDGLPDFAVGNDGSGLSVDDAAMYLITDLSPGISHPRDAGITVQWQAGRTDHADVQMRANGLGDVTGDGYADVGFSWRRGNALVIIDGPFGVESRIDMYTENDAQLYSNNPYGTADEVQSAVGLDWDGDGLGDVIVGNRFFSDPTTQYSCYDGGPGCAVGAAFILAGPIAGVHDLETEADRIEGNHETSYFGTSIAVGGDLDGDGLPDLIVTEPDYLRMGEVSVIPGHPVLIGLLAAALVAACHGHKAPDVDDTGAPPGTDPDTDRYPTIWYVDGDGDGYGGTDTAIDPPDLAGYAARSGDCDDTRAWVHPSALELPTSGVDDNCDGALAIQSVDEVADFRAVGFWTAAPSGRVFEDGAPGVALGDDRQIVLVRAPLPALDDAAPTAAATLVGAQGEAKAACALGDIDGDGRADLVVSGPVAQETAGGEAGSASIVLGPIRNGTQNLTDISWRRYEGDAAGENLGACIAAGDLNGDGLADVVLGAQYDPASAWDAGSVYILYGPAVQTSVDDADSILRGTNKNEEIGDSIAALGDIDGDGLADFAVTNFSGGSPDDAATYLITDLPAGISHPRDAGITVQWQAGRTDHHYVEMRANELDDVSGDGYADVGFSWSDGNALVVIDGPFGGTDKIDMYTENDAQLYSENPAFSYTDVESAAGLDRDGDGIGDIAVGNRFFSDPTTYYGCNNNAPGCEVGAVFIMAGPISGVHDLETEADRIEGTDTVTRFGTTVSVGGDLDGDGLSDLIVTEPSYLRVGEVSVIPGFRF